MAVEPIVSGRARAVALLGLASLALLTLGPLLSPILEWREETWEVTALIPGRPFTTVTYACARAVAPGARGVVCRRPGEPPREGEALARELEETGASVLHVERAPPSPRCVLCGLRPR